MPIDPKISRLAAMPKSNLRGLGSLAAADLNAQIDAARTAEMEELARVTSAAFDSAMAQRGLQGLGRGGFGVIESYRPRSLRGLGANISFGVADQLQDPTQASQKDVEQAQALKKEDLPTKKEPGTFQKIMESFLGSNPTAGSDGIVQTIRNAFQLSGKDKEKADAKGPVEGQVKLASMIGGAPQNLGAQLGLKADIKAQISADPATAAIFGAAAGAASAAVQYIGQKIDQLASFASCAYLRDYDFCDPQGVVKAAQGKFTEGLLSPLTPAALQFLTSPQFKDEINAAKACDSSYPGQWGKGSGATANDACPGWNNGAGNSDDMVRNLSVLNYRVYRLQTEAALRATVGCFNKDELQIIKNTATLTGMLQFIGAQTTSAALDMAVFTTNLNWITLTQEQKDSVQRAVDRQLQIVGGSGGRGGNRAFITKDAKGETQILGMSPLVFGLAAAGIVGVGLFAVVQMRKR